MARVVLTFAATLSGPFTESALSNVLCLVSCSAPYFPSDADIQHRYQRQNDTALIIHDS